ncbi:MAG: lipase family protein, partial [Myxococcota bacterium]
SSPYAGTGWTSTGSSHSEQHLGATVCVRTDNGGRYYNARDVLIAFRGTVRNSEWVADADMRHTTATAGGHSLGTTHNGFWTLFNEIYTGGQGSNTMEIFLRNYRPSRVFLTGHSLGGAMCHLATLVIPNTVGCPVTTCSYAAPRVSADSALDASYQAQINSGDITHFVRIVNRQDPVPMVPKGHGYHHPPSVKIDFSAFNSPETAHPHSMGLYKLYVTHSSNQLVYRRDDMA